MGFGDFLSDVAGAVLGGSSGKGDTGDKTVTNEPWSGLQPSVLAALNQAARLYNMGGPSYYPGSTVIPFSPQSQLGMGMMENLALGGSQYQQPLDRLYRQLAGGKQKNPALNYLNSLKGSKVNAPRVKVGQGLSDLTRQTYNDTMSGNYLNANPYLDATFNRASDAVTRQWNESVLPGVNSTFSLAGRTGSGVHQNSVNQASEQLGDTLSGLANQIYGGNYQQERGRMMEAADAIGGYDTTAQGYGLEASSQNAANSLAGQQFNRNFKMNLGNSLNNMYQQGIGNQLAGAGLGQNMMNNEWANIGRLMGVGGMVEDKAGQYLQDNMNRFNYYQNLPYQNFNQYVSNLGGIPGSGFTNSYQDTDLNQGSAYADWIGNNIRSLIKPSGGMFGGGG